MTTVLLHSVHRNISVYPISLPFANLGDRDKQELTKMFLLRTAVACLSTTVLYSLAGGHRQAMLS